MRAWPAEPPFVGRDAEFAQLEHALASRSVRPGVFIGGEAGVGKTRIVREFSAAAVSRGALVITGGCLDAAQESLPYAPYVEALGRFHEALGARAAEVFGELSPALSAIAPFLGEHDQTPVDRLRLFESIRTLFDRAPDPTVLVIEDTQWADASSLALLSYLVRRTRHGRLLLIATYRDDEVPRRHPLAPVLAELMRADRASRIDVRPLPGSDLARLVSAQRPDLPPRDVDAIVTRAEGNPFYAIGLLAIDPAEGGLPPTLRDVLLDQIARLLPPTRLLLSILAVAGRATSPAFLDAAWDGPPTDLDDALDEALERGIVVQDPDDGRVRFRHALITDAVREAVGPRRRIELHARLASLLSARSDLADPTIAGGAAELATHWSLAGRLPEALAAICRAAEEAARVPAWAEAHAQYERAVELWDGVPEAERPSGLDRATLLHRAAEAAYMSTGVERALELEQQAIAVSSPSTDAAAVGARYAALARWHVEQGDAAGMLRAAERAVSLVPDQPPTAERAVALASLASARMQWCRYVEARDAALDAAAVAEAAGATHVEAWALAVDALCRIELGDEDAATAATDRAVQLAAARPHAGQTDVWAVISAYGDRVGVLRRCQWGDPADLGRAFDELRAAGDRLDVRASTDEWVAGAEAFVAFQSGRWHELDETFATVLAPEGAGPAWMLGLRGSVRVARGELDDGERDLLCVLAGAPAHSPETAYEALIDLALSALLRRDPQHALELVDESARRLEQAEAPVAMVRTAAVGLRAAADLAEAARARRLDALAECAEKAGDRHRIVVDMALAECLVPGMRAGRHVRAAAALALAEAGRLAGTSDPERWASAVARLEVSWRPDLLAYARYRRAEALLTRRQDRGDAAAELGAARDLAERLRAGPLLSDIHGLARRSRLDRLEAAARHGVESAARPAPAPSAPRATAFGLSAREREVLAMLVDGRTNREIGEALFIAEKTASVHVTHILDKLGVNSRGAAAALAARLGLFEDQPMPQGVAQAPAPRGGRPA